MWAASLYLLKDISIFSTSYNSLLNVAIITATFCILQFTKLPPPLIVLGCLLAGLFF
jgi:chromate transporter